MITPTGKTKRIDGRSYVEAECSFCHDVKYFRKDNIKRNKSCGCNEVAKPLVSTEGTMTTRGLIKHHPYKGMRLPVKVVPCRKTTACRPRPPATVEGFLVFALPGGGDYVSGIVVGRNER